jgi:ribosomal protein S18 acetylase RimI-like enzyme
VVAIYNIGTFLAFILYPSKDLLKQMERARVNDREAVVDVLVKAFDDNKSVNYVVKQDVDRRTRMRGLMEYSFDICNAFGEVWVSEDRNGCALVLFKDKQRTTLSSILLDIKLAIKVIGLSRVKRVLSREAKIKSNHPKTLFAYLWFVGVNPEAQNKRIGSSLLTQLIGRFDSQNRPIYLETSVDRNLSWYQKHGFEIYQTIEQSYTLYLLRRKIRSL